MSESQHWLDGLLDILKEAVEGSEPGQSTAFLDGTKADGSGNSGLLATLDRLSAQDASRDIHGTSIAGQARHAARHLEVLVRWEEGGERGPFPWKESFHPETVNDAEWQALRERVRAAYAGAVRYAQTQRDKVPDSQITSNLAGAAAHVAYHLGSMRQMLKALKQ